MHELQIQSLLKRYEGPAGVVAVNRVSLTIEAGEMLILLGPSGCGKTTLLRCVAGLEEAQEGRIVLEGRPVFDGERGLNIPTHERDIGMVFQNYSLWPHMTVEANVGYPLAARGVPRVKRAQQVRTMLETVQCAHLADRIPAMLSGGQQQRIALARALASEPKVMLLDEPLSNLDALLRVELRAHLRAIHRKLGFTGIYVTHDQVEAFNLGSRVAVMRSGDIVQLGTPREVFERPASDYVARFLGIRNALALRRDGGWVTEAGPLSGDLGVFGKVPDRPGSLQLFIRPESLQLFAEDESPPPGWLLLPPGRVSDVLYAGAVTDHVVDLQGQVLYATQPTAQRVFEPGSRVRAACRGHDALLYADGVLVSP
ncbi:MAG: ABC transporter ATP-binding protein [Rhodoferax sp.]|nr:ABC transporter ATP-binding protein [Rhodoferax sp.]